MKIKKIIISGFRSIKGPLEIRFSQITALIGANNSGKSNILSAIYKVLGKDWITVNSFDDEDVYKGQYESDIEIEVEFSEPLLYKQFKGIDPIEIPKLLFNYTRYKVGPSKGHRRLEKKCLTLTDKEVHKLSKRPQTGQKREYEPLTTIPLDIQESTNLIYTGSDRNLKNQLPNARYSVLRTLMNDINEDFARPDNLMKVRNSEGNEKTIARIERFKQSIAEAIKSLQTEQFLSLEKSIKENVLHQLGFDAHDTNKLDLFFFPIDSITFYTSLDVWVNDGGYMINATELGGGFQNAIIIAILKAFEERRKQGAIFLIEEPEMYLHPQMQRSLYKTIRKIGETNQVIYITHSANFVTIPEFHEIVVVSKDENGTKVTQSELQPTDIQIEKFRKELDPERNELFFSSRLLIVEGDTEKLSLPEYALREGLDFDKAGASIIEVGGKKNLIEFIELCLSFKMDVGVVYDIDSSDFKNEEEAEKVYNNLLDSYKDKGVQVWPFNKNYEDELRNEIGERSYQAACQKYAIKSKPLKARLIATDVEYPVPAFIKPIIYWLAKSLFFVPVKS